MTVIELSAVAIKRLQLIRDAFDRASQQEDFLFYVDDWYCEWDILLANSRYVEQLQQSNPTVDWELAPRRPITRCVIGWAVLDPAVQAEGLRNGRDGIPYNTTTKDQSWEAVAGFLGADYHYVYSLFNAPGHREPFTKEQMIEQLDAEIASQTLLNSLTAPELKEQ